MARLRSIQIPPGLRTYHEMDQVLTNDNWSSLGKDSEGGTFYREMVTSEDGTVCVVPSVRPVKSGMPNSMVHFTAYHRILIGNK